MGASRHYTYFTPAGPITIEARPDAVTHIALGRVALSGSCQPTTLTNIAATQLQEYLAGKRTAFDFPRRATGTAFQQAVWKALEGVPYGQAATAAEVAESIGHAGAHRAVGSAVRANPLAIVVPGHRLVRANGDPWGEGKPARLRAAILKMETERLRAKKPSNPEHPA